MNWEALDGKRSKDPGALLCILNDDEDLSSAPNSVLRHYFFAIKTDADIQDCAQYSLSIDIDKGIVSGTMNHWKDYVIHSKERRLANAVYEMFGTSVLRSIFRKYRAAKVGDTYQLIEK